MLVYQHILASASPSLTRTFDDSDPVKLAHLISSGDLSLQRLMLMRWPKATTWAIQLLVRSNAVLFLRLHVSQPVNDGLCLDQDDCFAICRKIIVRNGLTAEK